MHPQKHASKLQTNRKKEKKHTLLNEKNRKSSKIRREGIRNSLQTRSTERKSSPRELPRLVAAIVALDQHKTPVYRYHRSITDAAKLAREFWRGLSRGWNLCERSESVAGVTITTPWEGCNFEGNLTWTAAASVSYGQMFTVEIVYSLFLQPLSWTGEGEGKGEERDRAGILRMSGFSYFIPSWMVSYKLPWCLHIPWMNLFVCWQAVDVVTRRSRRFGRGLAVSVIC